MRCTALQQLLIRSTVQVCTIVSFREVLQQTHCFRYIIESILIFLQMWFNKPFTATVYIVDRDKTVLHSATEVFDQVFKCASNQKGCLLVQYELVHRTSVFKTVFQRPHTRGQQGQQLSPYTIKTSNVLSILKILQEWHGRFTYSYVHRIHMQNMRFIDSLQECCRVLRLQHQ